MILALLLSSLSNIPTLEDTILINEWWSLGPFSVGVREGIFAVDDRIEAEGYEPDTAAIYPSIMVGGRSVKWERIKSDRGHISVEYKNVGWDTLQDIYGNVGVLNAGYVWASFSCAGQRRGLVWSPNVSSFVLNGRSYPADAYADGYFPVPVILKDGVNRVLLKFSGYGDHEGNFKISPAEQPLMIIKKDVLLPDFVVAQTKQTWLAVPVMNATERRLYGIKIEVTGDLTKPASYSISDLIPLACRKVPVAIDVNNADKEITAVDSTPVYIKLSCENFSTQETCWVRIKKPGEAYSRTFISGIDGSCQYYSVLPPSNYQKDSAYALVLTLHGAGVEARGQVAAYTQKDWAYVVAPTNRRRYGFDWQDWGRLDALEVLAEAKKNFRIDDGRVCLVGHSMGGHGTWHVGLSHPDLFCAIAPSAGWSSIQLYAPFTLQRSGLFAEPEQLKFRDMVMREDVTPLFLENTRDLPIYILHGGADDNVPPVQGRLMSKLLSDMGYEHVFDEVPGQGHWWNIDSTPGTDCIDKKEMMDWLRQKTRDTFPYPSKIVFKTTDLAHTNQAYWVRINELENLYQEGKIEVKRTRNCMVPEEDSLLYKLDLKSVSIDYTTTDLNIKTNNIKKFSIFIEPKYWDELEWRLVYVNNKLIREEGIFKPFNGWIAFYKDGDKFKIGKPKENGLYKSPKLYGPIKRAYFTPFLLVYGTRGDSLSTERNLHQARLQSYTWWMRANGFVEVVPDTEVTEEIAEKYNLILFGNNETNAYIKYINYKLPIHMEYGHVIIGEEKIDADSLCLMEIYPNPHSQSKFVLLYSATNQNMEKYCGLFSTLYSSAGLPDFIVWDKSAMNFGWAGVVAAGFFDSHWRLDKSLMYIKE